MLRVATGCGLMLLGATLALAAQDRSTFWSQEVPWHLSGPPQALLDEKKQPMPEVLFYDVKKVLPDGQEMCLLTIVNSAIGQMNTIWQPCPPQKGVEW